MFTSLSGISGSGLYGITGFILSGISGSSGFSGFVATGTDLSGILSGTGNYNQENCCEYAFNFSSTSSSSGVSFYPENRNTNRLEQIIQNIYNFPSDISQYDQWDMLVYDQVKATVASGLCRQNRICESNDWKKCGCNVGEINFNSSLTNIEINGSNILNSNLLSERSQNTIPSGIIPTGIDREPTFIYCIAESITSGNQNSGNAVANSRSFIDQNGSASIQINCSTCNLTYNGRINIPLHVQSGNNSGEQTINYKCKAFSCESKESAPSGAPSGINFPIPPNPNPPGTFPPIIFPPTDPPIYIGIDPLPPIPPIYTGCKPCTWQGKYLYDWCPPGSTCDILITPEKCRLITGYNISGQLISGRPTWGSSCCWCTDIRYYGCCSGIVSGSGGTTPQPPEDPPNPPDPQPYTPNIIIENILYYNDPEITIIKNIGEKPQKMAGWYLISHDGTVIPSCPGLPERQTYRFPSNLEIPPGGRVLIASDSKASQTVAENPSILLWNNTAIWNNIADIGTLYNPKSEIVDTYVYGGCQNENAGCYKVTSVNFSSTGAPLCQTTANLTLNNQCYPSKYLSVINGVSGSFNVNCPPNNPCSSQILKFSENVVPSPSIDLWFFEDCHLYRENRNPDGILNFTFENCNCINEPPPVLDDNKIMLEIEAHGAGGSNGTVFWPISQTYYGGGGGGFVKASAEIKKQEKIFIFVGAPTNSIDFSIYPYLSSDSLVAFDNDVICLAEAGGISIPGKFGECYHSTTNNLCRKASIGGSGQINGSKAFGSIEKGCNGGTLIGENPEPFNGGKYIYLDQFSFNTYKNIYPRPSAPQPPHSCNDGNSASKTLYGVGEFRPPLMPAENSRSPQPGYVKISYPGEIKFKVEGVGFEPKHTYVYDPFLNVSTHTFNAPRIAHSNYVQYLNGYFILSRI